MSGVVVCGLSKSYGPVRALRGIDLVVEPGDFAVLLGPSGCGKSTLLNAIAGLDDIDAGTVAIGGVEVTQREPSDRGSKATPEPTRAPPRLTSSACCWQLPARDSA